MELSIRNDTLKSLLQTILKTPDVAEKMLVVRDWMKRNRSIINTRNYKYDYDRQYDFSVEFTYNPYIDQFSSRDDQKTYVKYLIIYFENVFPEAFKKCPYLPASLFRGLSITNHIDKWRRHSPFKMRDYLDGNQSLGCIFTQREVDNSASTATNLEKLLIFRISNSVNRLVTLQELKDLDVTRFKISVISIPLVVKKVDLTTRILNECKSYWDVYESSQRDSNAAVQLQGVNSLNNFIFSSKVDNQKVFSLKVHPLVIGLSLKTFKNANISDYANTVKSCYNLADEISSFVKKVFLLDVKFDETAILNAVPVNDLSDILSDNYLLVKSLKAKGKDMSIWNKSNHLAPDEDEKVSKVMFRYLNDRFKLTDRKINLQILFRFFGVFGTSPDAYTKSKNFLFYVNNERMNINAEDFLLYCTTNLKKNLRDNNFFRKWCLKRADIILKYYKSENLVLPLYSSIPGILPYMRFDFYKGLKSEDLTLEELRSLKLLRDSVEYHTGTKDFSVIERWMQ